MTEHIESDQNHTALPNTQHISPQDFLPIAKLAGKEWASPVIFYQRKARAESTRDVSLNSKPDSATEARDAAQRRTFEKMHPLLTLAEKFLPLEFRV